MARYRTNELVLWSVALIFAIGFSLVLSETIVNAHDPSNYVLAIRHGFNVRLERPHAPGSPLLVGLWQLIKLVLPISEHKIIVLCNSIFFGLSIVFIYKLFLRLRTKKEALAATLLFATNPISLYYGSVAEVYSYEAFFATASIYYFLQCSTTLLPVCTFLLGIAGGVRLSSVLLLSPVILYIIWNKKPSVTTLLISAGTFFFGVLIWLYPFYLRDGGIAAVSLALQQVGDLENSIIQNIATLGGFLIWGVNIGIIALFIRRRQEQKETPTKQTMLLIALWIIFPILFFIFGHYAKGYILLVLPAILLLVVQKLHGRFTAKQSQTAALSIAVFQIILFFSFPFIEPSIEYALPKSQRSTSERLKTAALRATSFFAPTYSHITEADKEMEAVVNVLLPLDRTDPIFVDKSASLWAYQRCLQALLPDHIFLVGSNTSESLLTLYWKDSINRQVPVSLLSNANEFYFLIDSRLTTIIGEPPSSKLVSKTDRVSLYYYNMEDKMAIKKYLLREH
ncbi:MAG TPA: glycosyltransferase family 39 protein [Candidatus Kapabacteria bacterium]|nr:glycosyltransferase family 39 protein [Candidatus Kapabacteria bacterium]